MNYYITAITSLQLKMTYIQIASDYLTAITNLIFRQLMNYLTAIPNLQLKMTYIQTACELPHSYDKLSIQIASELPHSYYKLNNQIASELPHSYHKLAIKNDIYSDSK